MAKHRSNLEKQLEIAAQIFVITLVIGLVAYAFRQQIISWLKHAIISALQAIFSFLIFFVVPFVLGFLSGKYLSDNQIVNSSTSFWAAIILCIIGLVVLGNTNIGYGIDTFLASFIVGMIAGLLYDAVSNANSGQSGGLLR